MLELITVSVFVLLAFTRFQNLFYLHTEKINFGIAEGMFNGATIKSSVMLIS